MTKENLNSQLKNEWKNYNIKKYIWKIRNNVDIKKSLHYINVDPEYINILLETDSDFMIYLNKSPKPKYVYIIYKTHYEINFFNHNKFGWAEDDDYIKCLLEIESNKYQGEINLRKQKLEKLKQYESTL